MNIAIILFCVAVSSVASALAEQKCVPCWKTQYVYGTPAPDYNPGRTDEIVPNVDTPPPIDIEASASGPYGTYATPNPTRKNPGMPPNIISVITHKSSSNRTQSNSDKNSSDVVEITSNDGGYVVKTNKSSESRNQSSSDESSSNVVQTTNYGGNSAGSELIIPAEPSENFYSSQTNKYFKSENKSSSEESSSQVKQTNNYDDASTQAKGNGQGLYYEIDGQGDARLPTGVFGTTAERPSTVQTTYGPSVYGEPEVKYFPPTRSPIVPVTRPSVQSPQPNGNFGTKGNNQLYVSTDKSFTNVNTKFTSNDGSSSGKDTRDYDDASTQVEDNRQGAYFVIDAAGDARSPTGVFGTTAGRPSTVQTTYGPSVYGEPAVKYFPPTRSPIVPVTRPSVQGPQLIGNFGIKGDNQFLSKINKTSSKSEKTSSSEENSSSVEETRNYDDASTQAKDNRQGAYFVIDSEGDARSPTGVFGKTAGRPSTVQTTYGPYVYGEPVVKYFPPTRSPIVPVTRPSVQGPQLIGNFGMTGNNVFFSKTNKTSSKSEKTSSSEENSSSVEETRNYDDASTQAKDNRQGAYFVIDSEGDARSPTGVFGKTAGRPRTVETTYGPYVYGEPVVKYFPPTRSPIVPVTRPSVQGPQLIGNFGMTGNNVFFSKTNKTSSKSKKTSSSEENSSSVEETRNYDDASTQAKDNRQGAYFVIDAKGDPRLPTGVIGTTVNNFQGPQLNGNIGIKGNNIFFSKTNKTSSKSKKTSSSDESSSYVEETVNYGDDLPQARENQKILYTEIEKLDDVRYPTGVSKIQLTRKPAYTINRHIFYPASGVEALKQENNNEQLVNRVQIKPMAYGLKDSQVKNYQTGLLEMGNTADATGMRSTSNIYPGSKLRILTRPEFKLTSSRTLTPLNIIQQVPEVQETVVQSGKGTFERTQISGRNTQDSRKMQGAIIGSGEIDHTKGHYSFKTPSNISL